MNVRAEAACFCVSARCSGFMVFVFGKFVVV